MLRDIPMARPAARFLRKAVRKVDVHLQARRLQKRELARALMLTNVLAALQQRFDEERATDIGEVRRVAGDSSLIVLGVAPFANVSMLIDALSKERVVLGELVIVDATAETLRGAAIHQHLSSWGLRLPFTRLKVLSYGLQDIRLASGLELGAAQAQGAYLWFAGRDYVPLPHALEYLIKAHVSSVTNPIVTGWTLMEDDSIPPIELPASFFGESAREKLRVDSSFSPFEHIKLMTLGDLSAKVPVEACSSFTRGIFGGARSSLTQRPGDPIFDSLMLTEAATAELSLRLKCRNIELLSCPASLALCLRSRLLDGAAPWEEIHDWRWIQEKQDQGRDVSQERLEMVCPFHRGDVVLATQIAAHLRKQGRPVRLHVAKGLESWARSFDPSIEVEAIPVPVASAEETYPQLLAAYRYVSQRNDASARLARCHPARSLSDTGENLLDYMYEQAGLQRGLLLENVKPQPSDEDFKVARELVEAYGGDAVFVHPFGGWELKSIPVGLMEDMARRVHRAGFKLVQIGGMSDKRIEVCDGGILENFLPTRWRAILELGRALIGVDSWTAHFASILDVPQVTLFGSTHPRHVRTKQYFAKQESTALALGPIVNCSPCNSLTCIAFPGQRECAGFTLGREFDEFLLRLRL